MSQSSGSLRGFAARYAIVLSPLLAIGVVATILLLIDKIFH
jgi:hypothetical protein